MKTMSKHTPGPYIAVTFFNEVAIQQDKTLPVGDRPEIATLSLKSVVLSEEEQIANGHLFAAAPCMFKVLEDVFDALTDGGLRIFDKDQNDYHTSTIKRVLAKARGETNV